MTKRSTKVALRGTIPRGVSSHHVLTQAFGDAYMRRENVRHATLLFRAEGVNVRTKPAWKEGDKKHEWS